MSTLAWLEGLPPTWYGLAFFAGLILIAVFRLISAAAYQRRSLGKYAERHSEKSSLNPLRKDFQSEVIHLQDFYHPYQQMRSNLTFRDCELYGPAQLFMYGQMSFWGEPCFFHECNAVIMKDAQPLVGAIRLQDVSFSGCRFFGVTLLVTAKDARGLKGIITFGEKTLPIITDGTYGEI